MEPETTNISWYSRNVIFREGTLSEFRQYIPKFEKVPFSLHNEGTNPHLYVIIRERLEQNNQGLLLPNEDQVRIPIGVVSEKYRLVQHYELLNVLERALHGCGFDVENFKARLWLTEFGERMWISFILAPSEYMDFYPDDLDGVEGELTLNAINSVDKSTALTINLSWHRLVCKNGMIIKNDIVDLKRKHTGKLDSDTFEHYLQRYFSRELFELEIQKIMSWYTTEVAIKDAFDAKPSSGSIEHWLEYSVSKKWGIHAAARAYHIAKTGLDAEFFAEPNKSSKKKKVRYNDLKLRPKSERYVSGSYAPVRNAYDISQVLSWIATQQQTLQIRLKWMMEIPPLMRALLKHKSITLTIENKRAESDLFTLT